METINAIELTDEKVYPSPEVLEKILGPSYGTYLQLLALLDRHGLEGEWRYYRDGKAWLYKAQKKKRTLLWMSAWRGFMQGTVYFPDRYEEEIYALQLREATKDRFRAAKRVGKSIPCIFEIRDPSILPDLERVLLFKLAAT